MNIPSGPSGSGGSAGGLSLEDKRYGRHEPPRLFGVARCGLSQEDKGKRFIAELIPPSLGKRDADQASCSLVHPIPYRVKHDSSDPRGAVRPEYDCVFQYTFG